MKLVVKEIDFSNFGEKYQLSQLLLSNNLLLDLNLEIDESIGLFSDNQLIATASINGRVIKGFALKEGFQKINFIAVLLGELLKKLLEKGIKKNFIFTQKKYRQYFECLGYRFIAKGENSILLEYGLENINDYLEYLKEYVLMDDFLVKGSIVISPKIFDPEQLLIIEEAALNCDILYIFAIHDNGSLYQFCSKKRLIVEKTNHLKNVIILDGGDYVNSFSIFPEYFIRNMSEKIKTEAIIDLDIFTRYISTTLGISKRFVERKPWDEFSCLNNEIIKMKLSNFGIEYIEIEKVRLTNDCRNQTVR